VKLVIFDHFYWDLGVLEVIFEVLSDFEAFEW
jgi:hypothetical protein